MWQLKDDVSLPNENLQNTLEKQVIYKSYCSNGSTLRLTQLLSETQLTFDIPNYFLNLWISYFRDASEVIEENIKAAESVFVNNIDNLYNKSIIENGKLLRRKLKDYESIFDYYALSNQTFASQSPVKIRKSSLKNVENIKFLPINLHLERFVVEQSLNLTEKKTKYYDFTSVGAFTTAHTNKPAFPKPIESIMMNEQPFLFNYSHQDGFEHNLIPNQIIYNEILLVYYALKLLIQIVQDVRELKRTKDQFQIYTNLNSLSKNLQIIYKCLIQSYEKYTIDMANVSKIDRKQFFFNINEKLRFFRVKIQAFDIEIVNILQNNQFENFEVFLNKLDATVIELYNTLIIDAIPDKFDFVNNCASFSQAITALIASIDFKYYNNAHVSVEERTGQLEFHIKNGMLFQVESILSCFSNELEMIYDHANAIKALETIVIHLPLDGSLNKVESGRFSVQVDIRSDGFHIYLYTPIDPMLKGIRIYPVVFNVGINEQAISSNFLGNNLIQKFLNTQSIVKLRSYYENARTSLMDRQTKLDLLFYQLRSNKAFVEDSRPVELLHVVAEITRMLNGFRCTNCKSGKDRTGVSVSLEQCMILSREHNLLPDARQFVLDDFRRNGTRLDVVKKNVGSRKYAFNKIRYYLLPQLYRPPIDLCDDLET